MAKPVVLEMAPIQDGRFAWNGKVLPAEPRQAPQGPPGIEDAKRAYEQARLQQQMVASFLGQQQKRQ